MHKKLLSTLALPCMRTVIVLTSILEREGQGLETCTVSSLRTRYMHLSLPEEFRYELPYHILIKDPEKNLFS